MTSPRPYAGLSTRDQWLRSAHDHTTYDAASGAVELDWESTLPLFAAGAVQPVSAGLAFDSHCRLHRSVPSQARIERMLWAAHSIAAPATPFPESVELLHVLDRAVLGDFEVAQQALRFSPRGLAFDSQDRLYIADAINGSVMLMDLWDARVRRAATWPAWSGGPDDLAAHADTIYVVTREPAKLYRMTATRGPRAIDLPYALSSPARIAVSPSGEIALLSGAASEHATVLLPGRPNFSLAVPGASDLEFERDANLVLAYTQGSDFLRFRLPPTAAGSAQPLPPLKARAYDGQGIVRTPDGHIGFFTAQGFRHAVPARLRFARSGRVTSYRLDSGDFQMQWGRLFIDACIPHGTGIRVAFLTQDDADEDALTLPRTPPSKLEDEMVTRPDLSPPMPPLRLVPAPGFEHALLARPDGRELPWAAAPEDDFRTYELPIDAPAGRYLWVFLELTGNTRVTPRVRALRAEYPSHDLLRRIPAVFSRDPVAADFLRRFLAIFEGQLSDIEARAATRHMLLLAAATPAQLLPWLASFLGLVLDERWPEAARRSFVAEAAWLFRFRGTTRALQRMLEIALGLRPVLSERFRFRGIGTIAAGSDAAASGGAILGGGFRIGGQLDSEQRTPRAHVASDAFDSHAHRFSVLLPRELNADELARAKFILENHRPAHTQYEICSFGAGMRTGSGLHVGVSSFVGRALPFSTLQLARSTLGQGAIVGKPQPGFSVGLQRLPHDTAGG